MQSSGNASSSPSSSAVPRSTMPSGTGNAAPKQSTGTSSVKPIAKDKMDKAGKLAADIAKQPGLTDTRSLATKVGQQISSVGGSQSDVGLMTGLVQAQLANQGVEVKEDAQVVSERNFMDVVRGAMGRAKKPAKAAPVLTAPQVQAIPKTASAATAKAAPALTRSVPINYANIVSKPQAQDAFRNMMEVFGFHGSDAAKIERALHQRGVYSLFIGHSFEKWTTQTWNRVSARWEKFFHVTVTGQGEERKMTISVTP